MLFSMHAADKPGTAETRKTVHPDHLAHLKRASDYNVTIVAGGPLLNDEGTLPIGSLMLLNAPDRASVEAFNRADPLHKSGVWDKVEIRRFDRKQ